MEAARRQRRATGLTAAFAALALAGAGLATATGASEGDPSAAASPAVDTPIPPAMDSVVWDENGGAEGDDDFLGPTAGASEYAFNGYAWERTDLTYAVDAWTPDLTLGQTSTAIRNAFDTWASVSSLTFTEVAPCGLSFNNPFCTVPDIRIVFGAGDHGTGPSDPDFDGPGGVVAHAYGPAPDSWGFTAAGDIHVDDAETWRVNGSAPDLETVLLHESGHALGLAHSGAGCSAPPGPNRPIMCSVLTGTQRVLSGDDIAGIQALYGAPQVDLPDGLDVEIMGGGSGGAESGANDNMIEITNGYDDDLQGASLSVTGVPGCDEPILSVPANSITYTVCDVDPSAYLFDLDTSESLTMTATVSADGVSDASDGPVAIDVVADDHPFSDVPPWVDPAVDWIWWWGLADGYPGGYYKPNADITRAQVTRMIWRHAGEPSTGNSHDFRDVPVWVEDAVDWASFDPDGEGGIEPLIAGYPDGTFRGGNPITRAEVIRLLYRYVGSPDVSGLPPHGFSDVPAWVEDAVRWAAHDPDGAGPLEPVVGGYPDGTFRPNDDITRAQLTRALFRLTDQLVD